MAPPWRRISQPRPPIQGHGSPLLSLVQRLVVMGPIVHTLAGIIPVFAAIGEKQQPCK